MGMPRTDGDSGSAEFGVTLPGGNSAGLKGEYTVHHTVFILLLILGLLWLLGGVVFRGIRM